MSWSMALVSDDEEEPVQETKRATRMKNRMNNDNSRSKRYVFSILSSDGDGSDDDDGDELWKEDNIKKSDKGQISKKKNLRVAQASIEMISDDEDKTVKDKKRQIRKPTKRKANDYNAKPGKSDYSSPKKKKYGIRDDAKNERDDDKYQTSWKEQQLLADRMNLDESIAENIINLLEDGNTIPFIARYRREVTGDMSPEILRHVKSAFEEICDLKQKIKTVISTLEKSGKLSENIERAVKSTRSLEELEIIYAPYKPEGKRTLAERAKALGLEYPAMELLQNNSVVDLNKYINSSKEDLNNVANIEKGVKHIIAHKIATDSDVLTFLRDFRKEFYFTIETRRLQTKATGIVKKEKARTIGEKPVDESTFTTYFDFKTSSRNIKPHQVLAINRGEHKKILSVKIITPDFVFTKFRHFCSNKWMKHHSDRNRVRILEEAIEDSYNRLVQPFLIREIRSELKTMAEKASHEVFSKNLKHLLLAAPIKGRPILGIDPGYSHGCKIAVISPNGAVLDHNVIYPHSSSKNRERANNLLRNMLEKYDCSFIALGDGTACKQTEEWITKLIIDKYFQSRDVKYTIVSEDGASIYSCSEEAKKEFGDMDCNIISAVSLARRVQDPLAELVKIEPKHLGVGMYQHDLRKKSLDEALKQVVSECVSFVGVDLNTASQALLRHIAGLTDKRASEIIKYREKKGSFKSRMQLKEISGIGPKIFQQCAGFLRVGPTDSSSSIKFYENSDTTKLDQTYIHPESYDLTEKLLGLLKLNANDIGENIFITKIESAKSGIAQIEKKLGASKGTLDLIFEVLVKPLNYDLRTEISQTAFFSSGLKSMDDLNVGNKVMGRIKNVTHFGCFVDIGVGKDALIHSSKLGKFDLQIGDRIEGVVIGLERERKRIGVEPIAKL